MNQPTAGRPIAPIDLAFETPASAEVVWRHLTDPTLVATWFTEASPVGAVGDPYRLDFGDGSVVEGPIVRLEPGRCFAHGWTWTDATPGESTLVTWSVDAQPTGLTQVRLVHEGWTEAGLEAALRDDHESYWSGYLDDLRDVLEDAVTP